VDARSAADDLRHRTAGAGALLFFLGMITGLWAGAALTDKVKLGIPHLALAAHLNALLGGLWLIAVAVTLPFLSYGDTGKRRLAIATAVPAYGNWLITVFASFLGVTGLDYTGDHANDGIALLLHLVVVVPSLAVTGAWAWGFKTRR
jgi:hydroxylaminobenzene mutase